jgi:prevent-host-death family protein
MAQGLGWTRFLKVYALKCPWILAFEGVSIWEMRVENQMRFVNIEEAKVAFSKLVTRAAAGEDIFIVRNGKSVAKLTQLQEKKRAVRFGLLKGKIKIENDFDAPFAHGIVVSSVYPGEFS